MSTSKASLSLIAGLSAVLAQIDETAAPIRIQYDSRIVGPDGPWYAINQSIVADDFVAMYPSMAPRSLIISENACASAEEELQACPSPLPDLYSTPNNYNSSQDSVPLGPSAWAEANAALLNLHGNGVTAPGQMTLYDDGHGDGFVLPASGYIFTRSEGFVVNYPGGASYTMVVGAFSLSWSSQEIDWTTSSGETLVGYTTLQDAFVQGHIPSVTHGLHVGAASHNIPGSLVLGGYDRSRCLTDGIAATIEDNGVYFGLLDIAVNVSSGGFAWKDVDTGHVNGLLLEDDGDPPDALPMSIFTNPFVPYMYLPKSTCDAIAALLPVTYDPAYKLYFWDTTSPAYIPITTSFHHLIFTFATDSGDPTASTIKIPFALLNLNLTSPLVETPTPYFPCSPWDQIDTSTVYTLGRAFMQAATLARNRHEDATLLSQAPGPAYENESIITFHRAATSLLLNFERPSWEDTWAGTLKALPSRDDGSAELQEVDSGGSSNNNNNTDGNNANDDGTGISTGAIAGIAVAIVLAVLAILGLILWRLRRRKARKVAAGDASHGFMASLPPQKQENESSTFSGEVPVEKCNEGQLQEMDADSVPVEMGQGRRGERVELAGDEGIHTGPQKSVTAGEAVA